MVKGKGKAVCNQCKQDAFFFNGKWWCAVLSKMGSFNLTGTCKNDIRRDSK